MNKVVYNNADVLMSCAAIGGFFTTIYFTIKKTPEAYFRVLDAKENIEAIKHEQKEKGWSDAHVNKVIAEERLYLAKDLGLTYAPAIVSGVITLVSIAGANKVGRNRQALMSSAINASNIIFEEYKHKNREIAGEKKSDEVNASVNEEHVNTAPEPVQTIALTGNGEILCAIELEPGNKDTIVFFRSSPQSIESARNDANAYLLECGEITQADLLYFMGLKIKGYPMMGTHIRRKFMNNAGDLLRFRYDTFMYERTNEPVLFVEVKGGWEYS